MERKVIFGTSLLLLAILTTSCAYNLRYQEATARNLEPKSQIYTTPVVADLKITGDRISHTEEFKDVSLPVNNAVQLEKILDNYQSITLAKAKAKLKADALVGAMFEVDYEADNKGYKLVLKITVTGYPAVYNTFRNATEQDSWMMKFYPYDGILNKSTSVAPIKSVVSPIK